MRDFRSARGRVHRGTLGFLACDPKAERKTGGGAPFVPLFLEGARERATAQGYGVETFLIDHPKAMSSARLAEVLASRGERPKTSGFTFYLQTRVELIVGSLPLQFANQFTHVDR